jgi:hypothetical protein
VISSPNGSTPSLPGNPVMYLHSLFLIVLTLHILILADRAQFSLNIGLMHIQWRRLLDQLLVEQGCFSSRGQL